MPRQQLQAMLDRYRADYRPDSLGYQTMIEDDVDDPEVRAEWRRDWHGTARALRDISLTRTELRRTLRDCCGALAAGAHAYLLVGDDACR